MDGAIFIDVSGRLAGLYVRPADSGGFVIPIRRALEVASRLKANPMTKPTGWVGLELQELTDDLKEHFSAQSGVLISSVATDSPAAKAGLRQMDLIETVAGDTVTSPGGVLKVIAQSLPGAELILGVKRNSRNLTVKLTVMQPPGVDRLEQLDENVLTLRVRVTSASAGSNGALISSIEPQSVANELGIQAGDVIQSVDRNRVRSDSQFWTLQRNISPGKSQLWGIRRGERFFFVAIKLKVTQS
jgi:serine protease Do